MLCCSVQCMTNKNNIDFCLVVGKKTSLKLYELTYFVIEVQLNFRPVLLLSKFTMDVMVIFAILQEFLRKITGICLFF